MKPSELTRGAGVKLTPREAGAVDELLDALVRSLRHRLPLSLELVELDIEIRRREGGGTTAGAGRVRA